MELCFNSNLVTVTPSYQVTYFMVKQDDGCQGQGWSLGSPEQRKHLDRTRRTALCVESPTGPLALGPCPGSVTVALFLSHTVSSCKKEFEHNLTCA